MTELVKILKEADKAYHDLGNIFSVNYQIVYNGSSILSGDILLNNGNTDKLSISIPIFHNTHHLEN